MIELRENAPIFLFTHPTDMRRGFDRLSEDAKTHVKRAPVDGGYFVFVSRRRDRVKILYWDEDGLVLWYKRLEAGTFRVEERAGFETITAVDLKLLLRGMELSRIKLRRKVEDGVFSSAHSY